MDRQDILKAAIRITEEAARGGHDNPAVVLRTIYNELVGIESNKNN